MMRNAVCPHCQQTVQVPDDLSQAHCVRCGRAFEWVNTQFTATPSALASQAIQPIDQFERNDDESPRAFSDWDEFRATSPAVQQELLELARRPMPDLRLVNLQPLPADLPREMDGWKRPLGTIEGNGAASVSVWSVVAWTFLIGGGLCVLGPLSQRIFPAPPQFWTSIVELAMISSVIWQFIRAHTPYTLWVFEEGLLWQLGRRINGCVPWKDVRGFTVGFNPVSRMPVYGLTAEKNRTFTIAMDQAPALMPLLEFVEIRLTAAQLLPRLELIYTGGQADFGAVKLDRKGFDREGFFVPWSQIERVMRDRDRIFVQIRGREDWVPIRYGLVSFPLVMMAISHILIDEEMRVK
jgi:hypothetical protein